jgi:hypothetical protein
MINRPGPELDAFEELLLAELKTVATAQSPATRPAPIRRRRSRLWYLPATGAAAAATIALVMVLYRPAPAYAVSGGNGKTITVKVNRLEGAQALQEALRNHGIAANITYLASNKVCQSGRFSEVDTPGLTLSVNADRFEVTIPSGAVAQGDTFVLSAAVTPVNQGVRAIVDFGIAQGPISPCTVVNANQVRTEPKPLQSEVTR